MKWLDAQARKYPFGTIQDSISIAKGVLSSYIAYKCMRRIMAVEFPNDNQSDIEIIWQYCSTCYYNTLGTILLEVGLIH